MDHKRTEIAQLIARAQSVAISKEGEERAAGKVLEDNPIARLLAPLDSKVPVPAGLFDRIELVGNIRGEVTLALGETSYLTSRRMWPAYKEAVRIAGGNDQLLYELFHVVPGTASLVERGDTVLVGVRSSSLAGTHAGMVSLPAGLMEVGERVMEAVRRELKEETSVADVEILAATAGNNPDAPNVTFVVRMRTDQETVSDTFEAKGKRFLWVPREVLVEAVRGDTAPLSHEFEKKGVALDSCKIAPDILSGIKQLYGL